MVTVIALLSRFWTDLMIMNFVFLWFIESLLTSHKALTLVNSELIVSSSSCGLLEDTKTLVPSANNRKDIFFKSLRYRLYRVEITMARVSYLAGFLRLWSV